MRKTTLLVSLLGALAAPSLASAQATVELRLGLPVVLPPMVVISPGVQVVPDVEEEVFFTGGYYWVRRDAVWYRSRDYRGGWIMMPGRRVPPGLYRIPPGHYRHWHPEHGHGPAHRGPAPAMYRPGPAPHAERFAPGPGPRGGGDWDRGHGGGGDHDRGRGEGGGKHGGDKGGKGHDKHGD